MILNRTVNMAVFVGGLMSYLRYLCLLAKGASNTYCVVILALFFVILFTLCW